MSLAGDVWHFVIVLTFMFVRLSWLPWLLLVKPRMSFASALTEIFVRWLEDLGPVM